MIYIFTQNIWAGESIIVLETMNNAGISVKREVMMVDKKNAVIINGEKLNAIEVITQSEYLKSLSTFVKNNLNNCQQGKFKHLYHPDLTTCQVEAIMHFCNEHQGLESITFFDDSEGNMPLDIFNAFSGIDFLGAHRPIKKEILNFWGMDFIDLDWD